MTRTAAVLVATLVLTPWVGGAQRPVFRAGTQKIVVGASVKKGNVPVAGLQAADFRLTDSGVRQQVEVASLEDVPLDISLLIDTSGSTTAALDTMVKSINGIADILKPEDRFRVLTIGLTVFHPVRWTQVGQPIPPVTIAPMAGISLVYDGLYVAATHVVESGRRHVVVALTDGEDACSLATPDQIRALGRRTEAIVEWVPMSGRSGARVASAGAACAGTDVFDRQALSDLASETGGTVHGSFTGTDVAKMLRGVLNDYRRSYLLSFTPEGVPQTGWHALAVEVVSGKYTVRARSGYFGDEKLRSP